MTDAFSTVLVRRQGTHGLSTRDYAEVLDERLPKYSVVRADTPQEERALIEDAEVITGQHIDEQLLGRARNLRLFAGMAAGYGHLPLEALKERNVAVTTGSGIHAPNIAEQVLGYMLVFTRRLQEAMARQQRREWRHFQADELQNSVVTIVGLGSIGQAIADRLEGFGVRTQGVRYTPEKGGPTDQVFGFDDDIHELLADTDYLVIASPLTEETQGLIGRSEFKTLPPTAVVINVGRGQIIDTNALVTALGKNQIRGAALDVTDPEPLPSDHPLWQFGNVLITPHNGGHSPKLWDRLADILVENLRRVEETGTYRQLQNQIVYPSE